MKGNFTDCIAVRCLSYFSLYICKLCSVVQGSRVIWLQKVANNSGSCLTSVDNHTLKPFFPKSTVLQAEIVFCCTFWVLIFDFLTHTHTHTFSGVFRACSKIWLCKWWVFRVSLLVSFMITLYFLRLWPSHAILNHQPSRLTTTKKVGCSQLILPQKNMSATFSMRSHLWQMEVSTDITEGDPQVDGNKPGYISQVFQKWCI